MSLSFLAAVDESVTDTVALISMIAVTLVVLAVILVCVFGKKYSTGELAFAGICLSASFALSFLKFSPVQYGGSVTLASFVPLLIYAYRYGAVKGLLSGIIFGLLNFISSPYILTPLTFILDYILAFASIALMGFAPKFKVLSVTAQVCIGTVLVYILRFSFHLLSGFIFFAEGAIWADLPKSSALVYSLIYQCVYLPADCVICLITLIALSKSGAFERLINIMNKKRA